jgi:general nucleoside transport system permease protein
VSSEVLISIFAGGIALMVPVLWAALGEAVAERAGVLNIGIEGVMLVGAFACAWAIRGGASPAAAMLVALPVGALLGLVLAYLWVTRGADQIVSGIIFNLLALGATALLFEHLVEGVGVVTSLDEMSIPGLADLPWLGEILFRQNITFYLALVAALAVFWVLHRTWFGLHLRAAGEVPRAAETAGLSVPALRYAAVIVACTLTSFGGAALIASTSGGFVTNVTAGQGFVALAIVVLGRWNPFLIIGGALLFGVSQALQFHAQGLGALGSLPPEAFLALPYLVTIAAVVAAKSSRYPAACGVPFTPAGAAR